MVMKYPSQTQLFKLFIILIASSFLVIMLSHISTSNMIVCLSTLSVGFLIGMIPNDSPKKQLISDSDVTTLYEEANSIPGVASHSNLSMQTHASKHAQGRNRTQSVPPKRLQKTPEIHDVFHPST